MKFRVIGKVDAEDLSEIIPYLARLIPNAAYNQKNGRISFKEGQRIITFRNCFVTMTDIKDEREAMGILKYIEEKAKETLEKKRAN